ncbi:MAG: DUF4388 domain-containing protein [Polyangiaceae bacterium]
MEAQGPQSTRSVGSASPIASLAGVRSYAVGDGGGNAVEAFGGSSRADEVVAISVVVANTFSAIGKLLGIGDTAAVTARSASASWIVGYRNGYCIAVETDAAVPTANVEFAVRAGDWQPKSEWEITDTDIEYVASDSANPATSLPPVAKPPRPMVSRPPAPQRTSVAAKAPTKTAGLANANSKGLRKAIAKGDLRGIREIAEHLRGASASKTDPCGAGSSADAVGPLIAGIASALSGDNVSALKLLDAVSQRPDIGPSLQWAAAFWSSRASIGMNEGLEAASVYAESAARIAKQLDVETRAASHKNLAEVSFHRNDFEHTGRCIEVARRLAESLSDNECLSELSLLQAKTYLALRDLDAAASAAAAASTFRPEWHAPIVLRCRCALLNGDVRAAREIVAESVANGTTAKELLRLWRLVDMAKRGALPATVVVEYLALEEAPPSRSNLTRLEELCEAHPRVDAFRETFGWKLLKAGDIARASVTFDRLSHRMDLPDDVRSSVLLALGWLTAYQTKNVSSGAKLRATVEAAPKHLQSVRPPAASSGHMRVASPVDLVSLEPPPSSVLVPQGEGNASNGKGQAVPPVFTGNLEVFCLPDLLEFLRAGRRSGTLVCSSVRGIGAVHLTEGKIAGAAAPNTPKLQDLPIASGRFKPSDLERFSANSADGSSSLPIGTWLVKAGRLKTAELEAMLRQQIHAAISELLSWGEGQFAFNADAGVQSPGECVEIALDPQSVLLEIFKVMDEQSTTGR